MAWLADRRTSLKLCTAQQDTAKGALARLRGVPSAWQCPLLEKTRAVYRHCKAHVISAQDAIPA